MKKTMFALLLTIGASLSLVSCLEGGNSSQFSVYGKVSYDNVLNSTVLLTADYPYAAPQLMDKFEAGDCVFADVLIDYDNQPSRDYISVTNIAARKLPRVDATVLSDWATDSLGYSFPINQAGLLTGGIYLGGTYFFQLVHDSINVDNARFEYKMLAEADTIYMLAKTLVNDYAGKEIAGYDVAFDMESVIYANGKDTTIAFNGQDYHYHHYSPTIKHLKKVGGKLTWTTLGKLELMLPRE
jgi:hypothetical protein